MLQKKNLQQPHPAASPVNFSANLLGKVCLLCYNGDNYSLVAFEDYSTEGGLLKHMIREVIGPSKELLLFYSQIDIASNCLRNIYVYALRQRLLSHYTREVFAMGGGEC